MLAQRGMRLVQTRGYADEMKLTFAAANQVFYDQADVKQIDVPTLSGAFGILPKHVPTLAVLQPGVVNVFENDGTTKKFFVSSGTVTVNFDSSVQVLAEEAHPVESLDAAAARECLTKAQQELSSATSDLVSDAQVRNESSLISPLPFRQRPRLPSPLRCPRPLSRRPPKEDQEERRPGAEDKGMMFSRRPQSGSTANVSRGMCVK